ncbi:MAG: patatin-like phospholipase family protein [Myxococcota bacterium]
MNERTSTRGTQRGNVVELKHKWILYFGGTPGMFQRLAGRVHRGRGATRGASAPSAPSPASESSFDWIARHDVEGAMSALQSKFVNLLVIDLRDTTRFEVLVDEARALLRHLDHEEDLERRYAFHRILVLFPDQGVSAHRVDSLMVEFGSLGVRHVLRQSPEIRGPFEAVVRQRALRIMTDKKEGKTAICAAGGGTTGIYFELGVLKCLDDCLPGRGVNDFDLYFGISAGAVVASLVSVGYTIDEIMASIAGVDGGRIPPLTLSLLRLGHFNYDDFRWRGRMAVRRAARALCTAIPSWGRSAANSPLLQYPSLLGPPFRSDEYERMLRILLEKPGATNDFRRLRNKLYVGASDQDARRHVLFGSEGHDHVAISRAVQASLSINPAFSSVPIGGRYYEDGAITRTSNFVEAINRNATLIIVVDPFVPYVSARPGFARSRGALYNIDQDIRTITYSRFERTRNLVLRKNPDVSSYTLLPSNSTRRILSVNPMDHRPFLDIWKGAYLSTLERVRGIGHRLRGDLADHHMEFDTERAEAIARQLATTDDLSFADFFVDRRLEIETRPLCNERPSGVPRLQEADRRSLRRSAVR